MKTLTKEKKIEFIRELADNKKITAYTISKNTNLTESGIQRVLNGYTLNPHINTVNGIYNYLVAAYPPEPKLTVTAPEIERLNKSVQSQNEEITCKIFGAMDLSFLLFLCHFCVGS